MYLGLFFKQIISCFEISNKKYEYIYYLLFFQSWIFRINFYPKLTNWHTTPFRNVKKKCIFSLNPIKSQSHYVLPLSCVVMCRAIISLSSPPPYPLLPSFHSSLLHFTICDYFFNVFQGLSTIFLCFSQCFTFSPRFPPFFHCFYRFAQFFKISRLFSV